MSGNHAQIAGVSVSLDHWIDGKRVAGADRFATASPIDGSHLADVAAGGQADVDMAVEAANRAFPAWAALGAKGRQPILHSFAKEILARADDLAAVETADNGSLLQGNLHRMVRARHRIFPSSPIGR